MPIELKDVASYLGIDSDNMEDFKAKFSEKYFTDDNIAESTAFKEEIGRITGKITGAVKQAAKKLNVEIDWTKENPTGKTVESYLDVVINKTGERFSTMETEFERKAAQSKDERAAELEKKFEVYKKKYEDTETQLKAVSSTLEAERNEFKTNLKKEKINVRKSELFRGLTFKDAITDVEKVGFNSIIESAYNFDIDETDTLVITAKDGSPVWNKEKASEKMTPAKVLEQEAVKQNLFKLNNDGGKPAPRFNQAQNPGNNGSANQNNNNDGSNTHNKVPISKNRFESSKTPTS